MARADFAYGMTSAAQAFSEGKAGFGDYLAVVTGAVAAAGIVRRVRNLDRIMCFVAGTPVRVLRKGADPDRANAALAAAESEARTRRAAGDAAGAERVLRAAIDRFAVRRPIERVTEADRALSRPEDDPEGELAFSPVVWTRAGYNDEFVRLRVRDAAGAEDTIALTTLHPLWVADSGGALVSLADVLTNEVSDDAAYLAYQDARRAVLRGEALDRTWVRDGSGSAFDSVPVEQAAAEADRLVRGSRGWAYARDIRQGFVLTTADGRRLTVFEVALEHERRTVYNFEVGSPLAGGAATHTYFVGDLALWAYNARCGPWSGSPRRTPQAPVTVKSGKG